MESDNMNASTETQFPNPPIVEAIVDLDCDFSGPQDFDSTVNRFRDGVASEYPTESVQSRFQLIAELSADNDSQISVAPDRHLFHSSDGKQIFQVRRGGFTFNRLAPYSSLDDYLPEIKSKWEIFRNVSNASLVRELRLRYINRIEIPLNNGEVLIDEYIVRKPSVPNVLTGLNLTGFFWQSTGEHAESGHRFKTVFSNAEPSLHTLSLIFDLEVQADTSKEASEWENVIQTLLLLRNLKNEIFLGALTDKCKQLFR